MKYLVVILTFIFANIAVTQTLRREPVYNKTETDAIAAQKVDNTAFTGDNQQKATSGYQKLPGGIIIQWGTGTAPAVAGAPSINQPFPIPFPTACVSISASHNSTSSQGDLACNCNANNWGCGYRDGSRTVKWMAIGY